MGKKVTETEVKKEITEGLKPLSDKIHVFRVWCGQTVAKKGGIIIGAARGTPDLCGFFKAGPNSGRFLGIEVKLPKAQFRPEQYEFATTASRAGAVVIGAESWEDCRRKLEAFL